MKRKKLRLDQIKVESFVTDTDKISGGQVHGTRVFCGTANKEICGIRWTFMGPLTGGCKESDLFPCPDNTETITDKLPIT
ncbi:MAG: pinensin family lanthipeptide [Bacteroidota bacterium]